MTFGWNFALRSSHRQINISLPASLRFLTERDGLLGNVNNFETPPGNALQLSIALYPNGYL
jgi:hypothetical protein